MEENKVTNDNRTDIIPNMVVGIYCPASLEFAMSNKKVWLRYVPKEPEIINVVTTNITK